jgi:hypothetical protein
VPSLLPLLLPFVPGSGSSTPVTGPTYKLEVAWGGTPRTATPSYTDMTAHVRASSGLSFQRGRSNEQDPQAQPGRASWEFINDTGDFTMGNDSSTYAPLQIRRPVRISATFGSATYVLWQGFIDSWENASDDTMGYVRVSASDRLARAATVKLPSAIQGEILSDSPVVYFPLGEPEGSLTAGDLADVEGAATLTGVPVGTGGAIDFGADPGMGLDGETVAAFTRVDASNGKHLTTTWAIGAPGAITLEAMVRPSTTSVAMTAVGGSLTLGVTSTGKATSSLPWSLSTLTGTSTLSTTELNHIALVFTGSLYGSVSATLYVNGVAEASTSYTPSGFWWSADLGYPLTVGGESGSLWSGQIGHVAVTRSALSVDRIEAHAAARNGWLGETTDVRFTRLCRIAGLPSTHYTNLDVGLSTMEAQPVKGQPLLDALRACAEAENGVVFVDREGVLTFAPRSERYGAAVAFTLDAQKAGQVGDDFTYTTDDSLLLNDVTVSRPNGATQRVVDATSVTAYETHDESLTLYLDSDNEARSAAQWRVYANSTPRPRGSQLDIELNGAAGSGASVTDLLPVDIGQRINVDNLPADVAATATADLFVEGVAWRIEKDRALLSLTTSPVGAAGAVWILEDPTWGSLDGPGVLAY